MNLQETAMVLAKCQAFDRRTVGVTDVEAWWEALHDLEVYDALDAVTRHYRDRREWIMPSDVRHLAADIDRERRRAVREATEAEQRAIDARPATTTDRSREVRDAVRAILPKGDPDKLRWGHKHWRELQRDERRRREAQPNPDFAGYPKAVAPSDVKGEAS
jgi:hypothetical protein